MQDDTFDFPEPAEPVEEIRPGDLFDQIVAGESVMLLDARAPAEYEAWRIEGENVETINIPYYQLLDDELPESTLEDIPRDRPITVVCAKGGASEYVAGQLAQQGYTVNHLAEGMAGWSRIYRSKPITRYDGPGTVIQYQRPSSGCLGYLIYSGDEAAVIDPLRAFTDRYLADAAELGVELRYAIDTHVHADHISGVRALMDEGVEGVLPAPAVDRGVTYANRLTHAQDGDRFTVGDTTIETVFTPGHTTGMTSFLIDDSVLLTGDGLFSDNVARPDLEAGDAGAPEAARQLYRSIQERILTLEDDVVIAGGHYGGNSDPAADGTYTATVGELKTRVPTLALEEDAFVERVLSNMPPRPANFDDIIATNLGEYAPEEEEAFELELGPNNCAASEESLAQN